MHHDYGNIVAYVCDLGHALLSLLEPLAMDPVSAGVLDFFHSVLAACSPGMM